MQNEREEAMERVLPSQPVEVVGWRDAPAAGDVVLQVETEVGTVCFFVCVCVCVRVRVYTCMCLS